MKKVVNNLNVNKFEFINSEENYQINKVIVYILYLYKNIYLK